MVSIDTRPDLIKLLIELNNYNCMFIEDDKIVIKIPQFANKKNDPWYGLSLICKPNRTTVEVYICKDEDKLDSNAYANSFDNVSSLDDLIMNIINSIKKCDICRKETELNDIYISDRKIICSECAKRARSRY